MRRSLLFLFLLTAQLHAQPLLQNKTAFVTGGSSGIGRAIVEAFAREGADVVFTYYRHEVEAKDLARGLSTSGSNVTALQMDIRDETSVRSCVKQVTDLYPKLDIIVNNAAILDTRSFEETDANGLSEVLEANVVAPFIISQELARKMIQEKVRGSIIHISSFRGERPVSRLFAYSMSKASLNAMTTMMASELAPYQIRVNAIAPGGTLTNMSRQIYNTEEKVKERGKRVPIGRYGQAEDHTALAVYLASDASGWTTGAVIPVDGGESTRN